MKIKLTILLLSILAFRFTHAAEVELRIVETTDLHSNMMDYDYYRQKPTDKFGYTRTVSLINKVRSVADNSVLIDNGDLIQGSPIADYVVATGLADGQLHPVYKAMNPQGYTVGNIGNHEFNFGLEFLKRTISGANFPYINANVYDIKTNKPYFQQYIIIDTPVIDKQGKRHNLKIGYIGFVPPQIMQWDKNNLEGKVIVKDIVETAKQLVPQIRNEGADLIIAIPHSGLSVEPYKTLAENTVYYLTQIPGIDAITFGHAHAVFPSKDFANLPGVDIAQGTINGIPAVMPGQWGSHVGVIDLKLSNKAGRWMVISAKAQAEPIYDQANKQSLVSADQKTVERLQEDHQKTLAFINQPIGRSSSDIYSYLVLVQDDVSIQLVNQAQKEYVEHFIQGDPDLEGIPVLSALAPFRAGGRKNDPSAYVEIPKGTLIYSHAADLYNYPNVLAAVKVTGENIKEWLECSAGLFNQVDTKISSAQYIVNWSGFRTYNFDIIDGVNYKIDITQPARYNNECELINPSANRIVNLTWQGKPIDPKAIFLIATDDYRANTGKFSGTGAKNIVFIAPDEVRSIVAAYIRQQTELHGQIVSVADNNWQIAPINTPTVLDLRFETSPSDAAKNFIAHNSYYPINYLKNDDIGFAVYQIDLTNNSQTNKNR